MLAAIDILMSDDPIMDFAQVPAERFPFVIVSDFS